MTDGARTIDLANAFWDPDGDSLTYTAVSSASNVAAVSVNGTILTVTPANVGSANITFTASDGRGGSASQTFLLTVTPAPNLNPIIVQAPADAALTVGDAVYSVNLGSVFSDPDGDPLTFEAVSSDPSVATVSINGGTAAVQALAAGTATIQVKALDGRGGEGTAFFQVNVAAGGNPPAPNQAPAAVSVIYEQVLTSGVTNPRTYDLSQLFEDADGDNLTFTAAVQSADIAGASISGSFLTLTPGTVAGSSLVTITAADGRGGIGTYSFAVRNAPLVPSGKVEIHTKQGVTNPVTYDLSALFPGQTSFTVYSGTPDSTFTGPATLSGKTWTWDGSSMLTYWVIGANGTAAVIQVTADPQGTADLYFSQYMSLDNSRNALELFFNPVGDTSQPVTGYSLEIHQYNVSTHTPKVWNQSIINIYKGMPYIFIDSTFPDYFDITNTVYYNDEMDLFQSSTMVTTGFVLKKNGVTIDVLGDPNGTTQFMPNGGTIIRKSGIRAGSSAFDQTGEWNSYATGTTQYFGQHTP
ncbi:Bacterial Ig-like domain (group 2) [compost metagenome]